jgi:hypothetical protein
MIRAVQRLLAPLRTTPPEAAWRTLEALAAERDAVRAVSAFIASSGEGIPPRALTPARPDGLSGARTLDMIAAQAAFGAGDRHGCLTHLARVLRSLKQEIAALEDAGRDLEAIAHLGLLRAEAMAMLARCAAEWDIAPGSIDRSLADAAQLAEEAVRAAPQEAYMHLMRAMTAIALGDPDGAASRLRALADAPWLSEGWRESVRGVVRHAEAPAARLRQGDPLRALAAIADPAWLDRHGDALPEMAAELALRLGRPVPPALEVRIVLELGGADEKRIAATANALIGTDADGVDSPSIIGLRAALRQRFGVILPGISLRAAAMGEGAAIIRAPDQDPLLVPAVIRAGDLDWWEASATAPPALRALAQVALRGLDRFPLDRKPGHWPPALARLRLVERMEAPAADAQPPPEAFGDAVTALAIERLTQREPPPWGLEPDRSLRWLPRDDEAALAAGVDGPAIAADPSRLRRIAAALSPDDDGRWPALVVRDARLRPLIRALLRIDRPDVPVVAVAECGGRPGASLDLPPLPAGPADAPAWRPGFTLPAAASGDTPWIAEDWSLTLAAGPSLHAELAAARSAVVERAVEHSAQALGIGLPPLRLGPDRTLGPRRWRLACGKEVLADAEAPPAGALVVLDSPERVRELVREAERIAPVPDSRNPTTPAALVEGVAEAALIEAGLSSVFSPASWVARALAALGPAIALRCLDDAAVLARLAAMPAREATALLRLGLAPLRRLLRALIEERVSLAALDRVALPLAEPGRVRWLAREGLVAAALPEHLALPHPGPATPDAERLAIARAVLVPATLAAVHGSGRIGLWLVEEAALAGAPEAGAADEAAWNDAFARRLDGCARAGGVVLATVRQRVEIRRRIAPRHPSLAVVAAHELPRGIARWVRGRIGPGAVRGAPA